MKKETKAMNSTDLHIRRWVATVAILAALIGGGILALGLRNWSSGTVMGAAKPAVTMGNESSPVTLGSFANGFSSVVKPALPAVVNIHSSKVVKQRAGLMSPFQNDPLFRQFFGNQFGQDQPQTQKEESLGSGVIVTPDGTIITNNHVIDGASDIKVQLSDKREFTAKLVGTDPRTDIAVLKINASGLPTLPIGDSSKMQVGDVVFAIGDPFGVGETATMGIISALGRGGLGIERYEDFIQTDAAINPGNSGGAMIDLRGNLIGINTAILSGEGGGNQGIGFAIPINMAHGVMDQIEAHGKVVRAYLGIHPEDVSPTLAKAFGITPGVGVLVGDVKSNTPAERAGLKNGDVILEINGQPVNSQNDLTLRVSQSEPGTLVKLKISRDGKIQNVDVKLTTLDEQAENNGGGGNNGGDEEGGASGLDGVNVQALTSDITQQLNLPSGTHGVVVTSVDPGSAAADAGLQRGMVIQEVNHKQVNNIGEYKRALSGAHGTVLLLVNYSGTTSYIALDLP
jgi:serine protease Do